MTDSADIQEGALTKEQRQRGQSALIRSAGCTFAFMICSLGAVGTLFLLTQGASPFQIGVLATLFQTSQVSQLIGLRVLPRVGKARLRASSDMIALVPIILLVAIAWWGGTGQITVWVTLAIFAVILSVRAVGGTAWWPLLQDNTAGDATGVFFARIRRWLRLEEIVLPLLIGAYLGGRPETSRFVLPFLIGAGALILGAMHIRKVPETPTAPNRGMLWVRLRLAGRVRSVRWFLVFLWVYTFIVTLAMPFWVVMLKVRGLPVSHVVWVVTAAPVGHVLGLGLWSRIADRHGGRSAIAITLAGQVVLGLAWLVLPGGHWALMLWGVSFFLLWGFLDGGFLMGRTLVMMDSVPTVYQADAFTLVTITWGIAGGMGGLLGGLMFQWFTEHPGTLFAEGRTIYLAAVQVALVLVFLARGRLSGHREQTPARRLVAALLFRMFSARKAGAA